VRSRLGVAFGAPTLLNIDKSTVTGNSAQFGGGAFLGGKDSIYNSTISGNGAASSGGGIVSNSINDVLIVNSTIAANKAGALFGGGILDFRGTIRLSNSTVSGNSAPSGGGVFGTIGLVQNTIIANNTGGNCDTTQNVTSAGYNLSSDNTCNFNNTGDLNNTDPMLGPLQNNGGPTQTMALLPGSPAIDWATPQAARTAPAFS